MNGSTWLLVAALLVFAVGIAHSFLGEKYILIRLFRRPDLRKLLGDSAFTARTLRFAWHLTTVAWWGFGAILVLAAQGRLDPASTLQVLAVTMLVTSFTVLAASRGRHLAWPVFGAIGVIALYAAGLGESAASSPAETAATGAPVLFVCDHGSVKSLMAASLFDEAAARRGLRVRALSRGVNPDPSVPAPIAAAMREDGFDVAGYQPQAVSKQDIAGAKRVIAIGVDLSEHGGAAKAPIAHWNDVPPASVDYPRAREDLARRIKALLDDLQQAEMKPQ
jgi:protein-tyrosine-phosphatase